MAIYGRALRDAARDEAAAKRMCRNGCGHPAYQHLELQPTFVIEDGEIVARPHPDYKPLHFHCNAEGCACICVLT